MASQTIAEPNHVSGWPAKPYRPTPDENAAIRWKVQEAARRCREERIKGRTTHWTDRRK